MQTVPAGPRSRVVNTLGILRDPLSTTYRWRERFGELHRARMLSNEVVVVGDPALVREIFRADPALFRPYGSHSIGPVVGPHSLLLLHGATHARERKLLVPAFGRSRFDRYGEDMRAAALREAEAWKPGDEVTVQDHAVAVSRDVIVRAVFGATDPVRIAAFHQAVRAWVAAWKPAMILVPLFRSPVWPPFRRYLRARAALDRLLLDEVRARQASGERGTDVLSALLDARYDDGEALSDEAILDELRTLLVAGHETTMLGIAWMMHHLHRAPDALARAREAARTSANPGRDPFLEAVGSETLRLTPVLLNTFRVVDQPWTLGGHPIDPGTPLCVSICLLHSRPDPFVDPFAFRPERFLERSFEPWEFLPFGGGNRRCIGASLASFEMATVVATWLAEHRFEAVDPAPEPAVRRNLSMGPRDGARLRYLGRV